MENHVGKRVKLRANKSRKRIIEKEGVIEGTYPSIFVVKIDEENRSPRKLSFCYSDLLTHNVELVLCDTNQNILCG